MLDKFPLYQDRQFVPETIDLTDLRAIEGLFERLLALDIHSAEVLVQWVLDRSELEAALHERGAILYIRMTCQTDDAKRVQRYKDFIETIVPATKIFEDRLNKRYLQELKRFSMDQDRFSVYTRAIRTDVELFTAKNVGLQTKVELLSQAYQGICGSIMVEFEGKERTVQEMGKFLLEPQRDLRERAWRALSQRLLKERTKLDELFNQMLELRNEIGKNAGFLNFRDFKFRSLHRFDYGPSECRQYHDSIERLVVPLWNQILRKRKAQMKLEQLRPWDTAADPFGRSPLKPFEDVKDLIEGCREIFSRVDKDLGAQFSEMAGTGLLDLVSRKGKAPGGYQSTLDECRKPFIFMNAVGIDHDVRTLLHEGGHAFHALACAHEPILDYRHGPMEFNEVASMGMELLADRHLDVFYGKEDERRSRIKHLEDVIFTLIWVATIDAFQHWIYENPGHSVHERRKVWLTLHERFNGDVIDWSGLEDERAVLWHRQLHVFEAPFYYIEYGVAQLGALQLWMNSRQNFKKTIQDYRNALSLGGSRPLPELFEAAGLRFDFSEKIIDPLMKEVQKELTRISG
ncbi:MAG: M3 family oligoendopeptidase [Candidatus Omnitrophica bacterium]|nr:M3 family oligoendopeptidase [Candidatus Omnitrophota bacterium]